MVGCVRRTRRHRGGLSQMNAGSPPTLAVFGEVLVEIMRPEVGMPLSKPGVFRGPFASGAPAIAASAAANLGAAVTFAGVVGDDPFGQLCIDTMRGYGVDVAGVHVDASRTTGMAFVAYEDDGSRSFLFHVRDAAAGQLIPAAVDRLADTTFDWLHVSGSSLAMSDDMRDTALAAVTHAQACGARIALDPNVRPEVLSANALRELLGPIVRAADVLLPSGDEACLLADVDDPVAASRVLATTGKTVILKDGAHGARVFDEASGSDNVLVEAKTATPADPTGAGDVFSAAYAVAVLEGKTPIEATYFAHAAAACAIETFGPMEGLPNRAAVESRL